MSVQYDLYETPSPKGEEGKKSLHARIYPKKTYTQKEFIEHVAAYEHLPKNMLSGALLLRRGSGRSALYVAGENLLNIT